MKYVMIVITLLLSACSLSEDCDPTICCQANPQRMNTNMPEIGDDFSQPEKK